MLIQCELQGLNIARPDSNGLISWGILQWNPDVGRRPSHVPLNRLAEKASRRGPHGRHDDLNGPDTLASS
jgi:hypothetical protein